MATKVQRRMTPASLADVKVSDDFWAPRMAVNSQVTLAHEYQQCKETGRIDAWKLDWKPGDPNPPHKFWDSDVAKWIEAVAYCLMARPDAELEALVDSVIDLMAKAQQPDGYLNLRFTVVEPEKRWSNLRDDHELYCAGHLIEAAVAWFEATGKRKLLDVICRYVDCIDTVFGAADGKKRGYPGHEEIELALVKLYQTTGEPRYLALAQFFVDERGRQPYYYDAEAAARSEEVTPSAHPYDYAQAHLPVRQQTTAEGHAVRAMYLFSGMADVAAETGDRDLLAACETLWKNVVQRRMYITGGVGSTRHGERFTFDYDLPNETAYAETCAAIGLVFWAHRMLYVTADGQYADVMERALYNGTVSGVSLDGKRFFYVNLLAISPEAVASAPESERGKGVRQEWFGCACCPPNIARMLAQIGQYAYSQSQDAAHVHLYVNSTADLNMGGQKVRLHQKTKYPWKEKVRLTVTPARAARFTLALRIPGWCRKPALTVNGKRVKLPALMKRGYAQIKREWRKGDEVELRLPMPVERIEAHPAVRMDCGRVALQRGPVVYCLEEVDNGPRLADLALPADAAFKARFDKDLLGGVTTITTKARRRALDGWNDALYRPAPSRTEATRVTAVPYCVWSNRTPGEMIVWIRQD